MKGAISRGFSLSEVLTRYACAVGMLALTSVMLCAQEYSFRYFGVTEGLTNLGVVEIFQDRVGFIG